MFRFRRIFFHSRIKTEGKKNEKIIIQNKMNQLKTIFRRFVLLPIHFIIFFFYCRFQIAEREKYEKLIKNEENVCECKSETTLGD